MTGAPEDDLVYGSIADLGARLRRRELTAVALTQTFLERIEALNPRINAFITVTGSLALERARRADAELAAGRDRGPLHGIPYALKDVIATKGILTTNGSRATADWVPGFDATIETRLDAAGGVLLGKLNLWEFAMVGAAYGDVRNPWAADYSPGGSSSGAGAAVAAGLAPLAIGTDTGGSVRVPAAHCGTAGLRPTYGRVSRYGVTANAWSVDTVGPLTHTVLDTAAAFTAIAGSDSHDRTCARTAVPGFDPSIAGDLRGLRVGLPREHFFEPAHPDVAAAVRAATDVIANLGATLVSIDLPHAGDAGLARTLHLAEAASFHEARLRDRGALLGAELRTRLERAMSYPAVDYVKALRLRTVLTDEVARAFQTCDVIAAPTDRGLPARIGGAPPASSGLPAPRSGGPNTYFASMTGVPSLAIPCGFSSRAPSLPISLLLHSRHFDETTLFRVGHAFQKATDWHLRRPSL